jgi:hypothetical protein
LFEGLRDMQSITNSHPSAQDKKLLPSSNDRQQPTREDHIEDATAAPSPAETNYPIIKKPVVGFVFVQRRTEIHTRPCVFEGFPADIRAHEVILGTVPAPRGIYAVEYLSEVMEDEFDDDAIPVDLGYEWPNRTETPDWQTKAGEVEERRRTFFGLSPAKRAEILKAGQ